MPHQYLETIRYRLVLKKVREKLAFAFLVLGESARSFSANRDLQSAAALAYYGFFALIPLLLAVLILLSRLTASSETALEEVALLTEQVLPRFNEVIINEIAALSQRGGWGLASLAALLWVATPFASALRSAFERIFKRDRRKNFLLAKLVNLLTVIILLSLFLLLVGGRALFGLARSDPEEAALAGRIFRFVLSAGAGVLFVSFFFLVFCPARVPWSSRLYGAAATTALVFLTRPAFTLFLRFNPNYGYAFGSLKTIFLVTVWIYYAFLAVLFGAEVAANAGRREALLLRRLFVASRKGRPAGRTLLERFLRRYAAGEAICREGEPGEEMFYLSAGTVRVVKGGREVGRLQPGDVFGEMAMLLEEKRTATVEADPPEVEAAVISRKNFQTILGENPEFAARLLKTLASRLAATTGKLCA